MFRYSRNKGSEIRHKLSYKEQRDIFLREQDRRNILFGPPDLSGGRYRIGIGKPPSYNQFTDDFFIDQYGRYYMKSDVSGTYFVRKLGRSSQFPLGFDTLTLRKARKQGGKIVINKSFGIINVVVNHVYKIRGRTATAVVELQQC